MESPDLQDTSIGTMNSPLLTERGLQPAGMSERLADHVNNSSFACVPSAGSCGINSALL